MWFRRKSKRPDRPLIFVCSPYRGDTETNVQNARRYCRLVMEQGGIPFAPHLLFTQFLSEDKAAERRRGLWMGMEMLRLCDELWAFGEPTEGMRMEIAQAERLGIPSVALVSGTLPYGQFDVLMTLLDSLKLLSGLSADQRRRFTELLGEMLTLWEGGEAHE